MYGGGIDAVAPHVNQVANDASLVIVAGSDTISPALSSLFYYLICNPVAYARLQAEIDNSGLSPDNVKQLARLSYLNAAMYVNMEYSTTSLFSYGCSRNETLRLVPPLLSGSMRSPLIGSGSFMLGP